MTIDDDGEIEQTEGIKTKHYEFGTAPLYSVQVESKPGDENEDDNSKKKLPVHHCMHYRWRGKELKDMSRVEYNALIGIKPIASSK